MASPEGVVWVHIPFSLLDLSHISRLMGSFAADPHNNIKELRFIIQSYNLTCKDLYVIFMSTLLPQQKVELWQATQVVVDQKHQVDAAHP